jgi:integrase/recombinase XerD
VLWHIPDTIENRERFNITPLSHSLPSAEGIVQIEKFKQWMRSKRYSASTITTYSEALKSQVFYRDKPVAEITNEDVIIYNNDHILKNNLSSYQNQIVNAINYSFNG